MAANCIFCSIIEKNEDTIVYQDEDLVVIPDIKPVSKYHFLVISRKHIENAKRLTVQDKELLEKLIVRANAVLQEQNVDMNDTKLAFHWPPFFSVPHLHLHAIAPASQLSFVHKLSFKTDSWWCVSPDYVLKRIQQ